MSGARALGELPGCQDGPIWDIWLSMYRLPAMTVADELGIFQALSRRPASAAEVAEQLGFNRRATEVLFTMLTALGLTLLRDGRHELAEITRTYLLRDSPYYWGPLLRTLGVLPQQRGSLIRALRAVDDTRPAGLGLPSNAWQAGHMSPEQAESVSRIMHCHSLAAALGAARSVNLEGATRLLDVGGGSGCFSIAMAQHNGDIRCTVMELPAVCEVARRYIEEGRVADRVDTVAIDMFHEAWPHGYDCVLFSNVFHDWDAATNVFLARRAYEALPRGGRIFVHEMLLAEDGSGPITTAAFSMLMLFGTQGRQYACSELRRILASAGFADIHSSVSYAYYSIVSARKP